VLNANAAIMSLDRPSKNPLSFLTDDFTGQSREYRTTNSVAQSENIAIVAVKVIEATVIAYGKTQDSQSWNTIPPNMTLPPC